MSTKYNLLLRLISLCLIGTFLSQEISFCAPEGLLSPSVKPLELILSDPSRFEAPLDFSTLKTIHKGSNGKLIIHIQDAHSNVSGQQNLASMLDAIMEKYGVSLILSEGGSKDCSLTPVKDIAPASVWKRVAKSYLLQGKLSGEEYLNLVSDRPMKIMGLEDLGLYVKSVQNYGALARKREDILAYLVKAERAVEKLKNKQYPKELLDYEKAKKAGEFDANFKALFALAKTKQTDLSEFPELIQLVELALEEKLIDFNLANLEQASLLDKIQEKGGGTQLREQFSKLSQSKNQKLSRLAYLENTFAIAREKNVLVDIYPNLTAYGEYLKHFASLDLEATLDQMEKAEEKVYISVIASAEGAKQSMSDALIVHSVDRYLGLLRTAYRIQMTTKDFNRFQKDSPEFPTVSYLAYVNRKLADLGYFDDLVPYQGLFEEGKESLEGFYNSVMKRDFAFLENTEKIMTEENQKAAVLITGGYHTDHLMKLLTEKGYSIAVLTPIVSSESIQAKYEKRLLAPFDEGTKTVTSVRGESGSGSRNSGVRPVLIALGKGQDADISKLEEVKQLLGFSEAEFKAFLMNVALDVANNDKDKAKILVRKAWEAMGLSASESTQPVGARLATLNILDSSDRADATDVVIDWEGTLWDPSAKSEGAMTAGAKKLLQAFKQAGMRVHIYVKKDVAAARKRMEAEGIFIGYMNKMNLVQDIMSSEFVPGSDSLYKGGSASKKEFIMGLTDGGGRRQIVNIGTDPDSLGGTPIFSFHSITDIALVPTGQSDELYLKKNPAAIVRGFDSLELAGPDIVYFSQLGKGDKVYQKTYVSEVGLRTRLETLIEKIYYGGFLRSRVIYLNDKPIVVFPSADATRETGDTNAIPFSKGLSNDPVAELRYIMNNPQALFPGNKGVTPVKEIAPGAADQAVRTVKERSKPGVVFSMFRTEEGIYISQEEPGSVNLMDRKELRWTDLSADQKRNAAFDAAATYQATWATLPNPDSPMTAARDLLRRLGQQEPETLLDIIKYLRPTQSTLRPRLPKKIRPSVLEKMLELFVEKKGDFDMQDGIDFELESARFKKEVGDEIREARETPVVREESAQIIPLRGPDKNGARLAVLDAESIVSRFEDLAGEFSNKQGYEGVAQKIRTVARQVESAYGSGDFNKLNSLRLELEGLFYSQKNEIGESIDGLAADFKNFLILYVVKDLNAAFKEAGVRVPTVLKEEILDRLENEPYRVSDNAFSNPAIKALEDYSESIRGSDALLADEIFEAVYKLIELQAHWQRSVQINSAIEARAGFRLNQPFTSFLPRLGAATVLGAVGFTGLVLLLLSGALSANAAILGTVFLPFAALILTLPLTAAADSIYRGMRGQGILILGTEEVSVFRTSDKRLVDALNKWVQGLPSRTVAKNGSKTAQFRTDSRGHLRAEYSEGQASFDLRDLGPGSFLSGQNPDGNSNELTHFLRRLASPKDNVFGARLAIEDPVSPAEFMQAASWKWPQEWKEKIAQSILAAPLALEWTSMIRNSGLPAPENTSNMFSYDFIWNVWMAVKEFQPAFEEYYLAKENGLASRKLELGRKTYFIVGVSNGQKADKKDKARVQAIAKKLQEGKVRLLWEHSTLHDYSLFGSIYGMDMEDHKAVGEKTVVTPLADRLSGLRRTPEDREKLSDTYQAGVPLLFQGLDETRNRFMAEKAEEAAVDGQTVVVVVDLSSMLAVAHYLQANASGARLAAEGPWKRNSFERVHIPARVISDTLPHITEETQMLMRNGKYWHLLPYGTTFAFFFKIVSASLASFLVSVPGMVIAYILAKGLPVLAYAGLTKTYVSRNEVGPILEAFLRDPAAYGANVEKMGAVQLAYITKKIQPMAYSVAYDGGIDIYFDEKYTYVENRAFEAVFSILPTWVVPIARPKRLRDRFGSLWTRWSEKFSPPVPAPINIPINRISEARPETSGARLATTEAISRLTDIDIQNARKIIKYFEDNPPGFQATYEEIQRIVNRGTLDALIYFGLLDVSSLNSNDYRYTALVSLPTNRESMRKDMSEDDEMARYWFSIVENSKFFSLTKDDRKAVEDILHDLFGGLNVTNVSYKRKMENEAWVELTGPDKDYLKLSPQIRQQFLRKLAERWISQGMEEMHGNLALAVAHALVDTEAVSELRRHVEEVRQMDFLPDLPAFLILDHVGHLLARRPHDWHIDVEILIQNLIVLLQQYSAMDEKTANEVIFVGRKHNGEEIRMARKLFWFYAIGTAFMGVLYPSEEDIRYMAELEQALGGTANISSRLATRSELVEHVLNKGVSSEALLALIRDLISMEETDGWKNLGVREPQNFAISPRADKVTIAQMDPAFEERNRVLSQDPRKYIEYLKWDRAMLKRSSGARLAGAFYGPNDQDRIVGDVMEFLGKNASAHYTVRFKTALEWEPITFKDASEDTRSGLKTLLGSHPDSSWERTYSWPGFVYTERPSEGARLASEELIELAANGQPLSLKTTLSIRQYMKFYPDFLKKFEITSSADGVNTEYPGLERLNALVEKFGLHDPLPDDAEKRWRFTKDGMLNPVEYTRAIADKKIPMATLHDLYVHLGTMLLFLHSEKLMGAIQSLAVGEKGPAFIGDLDIALARFAPVEQPHTKESIESALNVLFEQHFSEGIITKENLPDIAETLLNALTSGARLANSDTFVKQPDGKTWVAAGTDRILGRGMEPDTTEEHENIHVAVAIALKSLSYGPRGSSVLRYLADDALNRETDKNPVAKLFMAFEEELVVFFEKPVSYYDSPEQYRIRMQRLSRLASLFYSKKQLLNIIQLVQTNINLGRSLSAIHGLFDPLSFSQPSDFTPLLRETDAKVMPVLAMLRRVLPGLKPDSAAADAIEQVISLLELRPDKEGLNDAMAILAASGARLASQKVVRERMRQAIEQIALSGEKITSERIAKQLGRNADSVHKYLSRHFDLNRLRVRLATDILQKRLEQTGKSFSVIDIAHYAGINTITLIELGGLPEGFLEEDEERLIKSIKASGAGLAESDIKTTRKRYDRMAKEPMFVKRLTDREAEYLRLSTAQSLTPAETATSMGISRQRVGQIANELNERYGDYLNYKKAVNAFRRRGLDGLMPRLVTDLNFVMPVRASAAFESMGVKTIDDLVKLSQLDLRKKSNLGEKSLALIIGEMAEFGLFFGMIHGARLAEERQESVVSSQVSGESQRQSGGRLSQSILNNVDALKEKGSAQRKILVDLVARAMKSGALSKVTPYYFEEMNETNALLKAELKGEQVLVSFFKDAQDLENAFDVIPLDMEELDDALIGIKLSAEKTVIEDRAATVLPVTAFTPVTLAEGTLKEMLSVTKMAYREVNKLGISKLVDGTVAVYHLINLDDRLRNLSEDAKAAYLDVFEAEIEALRANSSKEGHFMNRVYFGFYSADDDLIKRFNSDPIGGELKIVYHGDVESTSRSVVNAALKSRGISDAETRIIGFRPFKQDADQAGGVSVLPTEGEILLATVEQRLDLADLSPQKLLKIKGGLYRLMQLLVDKMYGSDNLDSAALQHLQQYDEAFKFYAQLAIQAIERLNIGEFIHYTQMAMQAAGEAA